jgi:transposase
MDRRIKYSFRQKLSAVRSVVSGRDSCSSAARKIGGDKNTVRRWLGLYKESGAAGLKLRPGGYTGKFKEEVIRYMLKKHLSLMQTAAIFGIPNDHTVWRWLQTYECQGFAGLQKETRGRKKSLVAKKTKKRNTTASDSIDEKLSALQAENEYLRAENAFLKKLDALVQEEKAAKTQNRQQKPSKN